ncbi:MAG: Bax inhibitor-1/YccA family protein [Alphaproteobacteria bacterium]|nr:Bax inhibitor-1/YccA family protein [Alphaproteobacteria bacterium]
MVNPFMPSTSTSTRTITLDQGLRQHMMRVYNYMGIGLILTGLVAYIVANTALAGLIFGGNKLVAYAAMFSPLVYIMVMSWKMHKVSASTAQTLFWGFCALMGLSMSTIFLAFTETSIARAFFITAGTFMGMSLWGYTTKKDLTSMGSFLMMGVIGILLAMIVNIFMQSDMMQWIVSVLGVAIFTGLTAYDTQNIKRSYSERLPQETNNKLAVMGALRLYLNFINAFQFLLSLMGNRN